jgi:hypothetical protein
MVCNGSKEDLEALFPEAYKAAKERENFTTDQWQQYNEAQLQKILLHAFEACSFL